MGELHNYNEIVALSSMQIVINLNYLKMKPAISSNFAPFISKSQIKLLNLENSQIDSIASIIAIWDNFTANQLKNIDYCSKYSLANIKY